MRRVVLVLTLVLALLACSMVVGSVLSRASVNPIQAVISSNSAQIALSHWSAQSSNYGGMEGSDSEESEDPDMPKGKRRGLGNIDEKTYLRLRDEYIGRRRGIEPGGPFDPEARGRAVRQMQAQEVLQLELTKRLHLSGSSGLGPDSVNAVWTPIGPAP